MDALLAFDVESTGLNYRDPAFHLWMIGAYDGQGAVKIITDYTGLSHFAASNLHDAITFNGLAYDMPALSWCYGAPYTRVRDVLLIAYLLDETMPQHNLQACAVKWLGVAPWKDEVTWEWEKGPQSEDEWDRMKQYNARDTRFTYDLWSVIWAQLTAGQRRVYEHLLVPATRSLVHIYEEGLPIDLDNLKMARDECESEIKRVMEIIDRIAEEHWIYDLNPNSPRQVANLLFNKLNLKPFKVSPKTRKPSTDQESLKVLAEREPGALEICTAMLTHREKSKLLSSTLNAWEPQREADGRVHFQYRLTSTDTGRTSSPSQQLPRDKAIRRIVKAPPGYKLIVADQSQVELRLMAWRSRDPEMLAVFKEGKYGGDLHSLTGSRIVAMLQKQKGLPPIMFDKAIHKEERFLAKAVNFGTIYGAEAFTLRAHLYKEMGLKVTFQEAEFLRDDVFFGTFKTLPRYFNSVIEQAKRELSVTSPFGRVRHLENLLATDIDVRAEAARQAINTANQADASDITLIGLNLCLEEAYRREIDLRPIMFFHDANLFLVHEYQAQEAAKLVTEAMTTKTVAYIEQHFNFTIDVPLVAEAEVLDEWG